MEIRSAVDADLVGVNDVYNYYAVNHQATFDLEPVSIEARREWASHYAPTGGHRLLVAVDGNSVLGYATSSPFRDRPAYDQTVETSVYLAPDACGRGVGRTLYDALFTTLRDEQLHRAIALIAVPNDASTALHARCGFTKVGHISEAGWKLGRWWDITWWEKPLPAPS